MEVKRPTMTDSVCEESMMEVEHDEVCRRLNVMEVDHDRCWS